MKGHIVELARFGGPDVLEYKQSPVADPGPGALLVEVHASGVNYLDLVVRAGGYPPVSATPHRPGFEIAGIVRAIGPGVTGWRVGDRVTAITWGGGGYASHLSIPAESALPVPSNVDLSVAAGLLVQGLTALLILEEGRVRPDARVLIAAAAGGVGSLAVQIAKLRGAKVIGLASKEKHELVRRLGADEVLDYREPGWSRAANGVDLYLDSVGDLSSEAWQVLSPGSHWVVYGTRSQPRPLPGEAVFSLVEKNITLRGFNLEGSMAHFQRALSQLFAWVSEGQLHVQVTQHALADVAKVHTAFEQRQTTGKQVLVP